jgi:hypothetical protein
MVNTFLVDSDFTKSAQLLDSRRLGKQRVEAYQILNLIYNINILSFESGIEQKSDFQTFVKQLKKWYTSQSFVYILSDKYDPKSVLIKSYDKKPVISSSSKQRVIKMGFCNHPVVEMWYGYADALMEYIDAHIYEWMRRGYKNNMKIYGVKTDKHPQWCSLKEFHDNHRGALLKKEIEREEKRWYQDKKEFINSKPFEDYIWIKLVDENVILK